MMLMSVVFFYLSLSHRNDSSKYAVQLASVRLHSIKGRRVFFSNKLFSSIL
jgi:hypothetical protein